MLALSIKVFEEFLNAHSQILTFGFSIVTLVLSVATLLIIFKYTSYTKQTLDIAVEKDMKPILLREGFFGGFSAFPQADLSVKKPTTLNVGNIKLRSVRNLAKNITGSIVISGSQYQLQFANSVSVQPDASDTAPTSSKVLPDNNASSVKRVNMVTTKKWSWLPQGGTLICVADSCSKTTVREKDQIKINYQSITGKKFQFVEDENFEQFIFDL